MPVQTSYPGVYIEERPSGVRTIVGVSTSVTACVGATRFGPTGSPRRIRSVADYVRTFGPAWDREHPLGHVVAHFFANGGSEAIVVRVAAANAVTASATLVNGTPTNVLLLTAIGEGAWANRRGAIGLEAAVDYQTANPSDLFNLVLTLRGMDPRTGAAVVTAQEIYKDLSMAARHPRYAVDALAGSHLVTAALASPAPASAVSATSRSKAALPANVGFSNVSNRLRVAVDFGPPIDLVLFAGETTSATVVNKARAAVATEITAALTAAGIGAGAALDGSNFLVVTSTTAGVNSAVTVSPAPVADASQTLGLGVAFGGTEASGAASLLPVATGAAPRGFTGGVEGGTDAANANGVVTAAQVVPASGSGGIFSLSSLLFPRFNLLCVPDVPATDPAMSATAANSQALGVALDYCKEQRAFLIVDTPRDVSVTPPREWATDPPALGGLPALGEHGAIYFPRLRQIEVGAGGATKEIDIPASGAVAGVMARIDAARGVWKAPAGLDAGVVGASGLTVPTDDDLSGLLNPKGVNVLRTFPAAGTVVWGARTLKGDDSQASEFKYVPIRRLTDYIASSLYLGTQFAVFQPNDPDLWAELRLAVGTFMRGLYRQGAFQESAKRAESDSFFVICDETVNPQAEIDLGRVNVVVGFAPLKPAEFVIVTITQISNLEA
ncbi:MAG: phage tail sheath family protein [Acidimicrobiales bacterium]